MCIYSMICKYTTSQTFRVSKIFVLFLKETYTFIQQVCIKLFKSDSKGMLVIHAVLLNFLF